MLLPLQNGPRLGDQFLKRARLCNDKIKLSFSIKFFLGLEDGRRYLGGGGEAVNGGAVLGGTAVL